MRLSRTALPAAALSAALLLSACAGDSSGPSDAELAENAPAPVATLEAPVEELAVGTDVGQFFVTPEGKTDEEVQSVIAKLRTMQGVQSAELTDAGQVDMVFRGDVTPEARAAAVKQLATLGTVEEGI